MQLRSSHLLLRMFPRCFCFKEQPWRSIQTIQTPEMNCLPQYQQQLQCRAQWRAGDQVWLEFDETTSLFVLCNSPVMLAIACAIACWLICSTWSRSLPDMLLIHLFPSSFWRLVPATFAASFNASSSFVCFLSLQLKSRPYENVDSLSSLHLQGMEGRGLWNALEMIWNDQIQTYCTSFYIDSPSHPIASNCKSSTLNVMPPDVKAWLI